MLLDDFFANNYLPHKPDTSGQTIKLYRNSFRKFGELLGHRPTLDDLTDANVGRLMSALKEAGNKPTTVNKERCNLLSLWRYANRIGMIRLGPTVQPVRVPASVPTALTVGQLRQLRLTFDALQGQTGGIPNSDFLRACFSIQYTTAARIGAVTALEFSDIREGVITFRAETRKGGRKPIVKAVPDFVIEDIKRIKTPPRIRVFPIKKTNATKIQILYSRLFERAGVPRPKGKNSHLFRSTHATLLELAGGDATRSLGHSSRSVTEASYLDPRFNADRSCDFLPSLEQCHNHDNNHEHLPRLDGEQ